MKKLGTEGSVHLLQERLMLGRLQHSHHKHQRLILTVIPLSRNKRVVPV